jgi:hypothetical protein
MAAVHHARGFAGGLIALAALLAPFILLATGG